MANMSEYARISTICKNLSITNPFTRVCTKADARNAAENALRGNIPESFLYMNSEVWVEGTHPLSALSMVDTIANGIESWAKKRDAGCEVSPLSVETIQQVTDIHKGMIDGIDMLEEARELVFPEGRYWKMDAEIVRTHVAQGLAVKQDSWNWNVAKEWLERTIPISREKEQRWKDIVRMVNGP